MATKYICFTVYNSIKASLLSATPIHQYSTGE